MHETDSIAHQTRAKKWPLITTLIEAEHGQLVQIPWITGWVTVRLCWGAKRSPYVRVLGATDEPRQGPWSLPGHTPARSIVD